MPMKNNLKAWREAAQMTIEQLAERVDVSGASISRIESGTQQPRPDLLKRLCKLFGQPEAAFYSGESNVVPIPMGTRRIPVLTFEQAGNWRGMISNVKHEDFVWADHEYSQEHFGLRLVDNSMLPRFQVGDVVIIDPNLQPLPNEFVVAYVAGKGNLFLQYKDRGFNEKGHELFELVPLNDGYPSWDSDRHTLKILGTMVERREYNRRSLTY